MGEPKTSEFLLGEARQRYEAELARYNQSFSRAGIYLGVVGIYATVIARFFDKQPQIHSGWVCWFFVCCAVVLSLLTAVGGFLVTLALVGRLTAHISQPSIWHKYIEEDLRPFVEATSPEPDRDDKLVEYLRTGLLQKLSDAIDENLKVNIARYGHLHRASRCLAWGVMPLVFGIVSYAWLVLGASESTPAAPIAVRVVDPVSFLPYDSLERVVAHDGKAFSTNAAPTASAATTKSATAIPSATPSSSARERAY